jgi:CGNR zinc finger protein
MGKPKRARVHLQVDDPDLPMLPAEITIANLLPWDVDPPDFQTGTIGPADVPHVPTAAEIAAFERFLDDRFPRDKFPRFRREIDGPMLQLPKTISRLDKYRYIVEARRQWRAAARKSRLIALLSNDRLPLLRICEWRQCQKLFVAGRNNQRWCSDKCGAANRMEQMRAKAKEYELNRQRKKAAKEYEAAQKRQRKAR